MHAQGNIQGQEVPIDSSVRKEEGVSGSNFGLGALLGVDNGGQYQPIKPEDVIVSSPGVAMVDPEPELGSTNLMHISDYSVKNTPLELPDAR